LALEESALTPENFSAVAQRRDHFQAGFVNFIREGIDDSSIVACDPKLAAFTVLGGVNWAEKWYRPGGPWSAQQIAHAMADMLVRSLAAVATPPLLAHVTDYPDGLDAVPPSLALPPADSKPRTRAATARAVPSPRKQASVRKKGDKV
jgi:TetR/AcrR family transcriptional regulator